MRLFPNRKTLKPDDGGRWQFWRWFDVVEGDTVLLTRLTILRTPWFQILLHWINGPDFTNDLHDHPWAFVGFVLDGGYTEVKGQVADDKLINSTFEKVDYFVSKRDPAEAHGIVAVEPNTKTLIFTGPARKSWSFFTPVGKKPGTGVDVLVIQTPWKDKYS